METESDAEGRNALNIPSKILQGLLIVANQNIDVNLKEIVKDLNLAHMERQSEKSIACQPRGTVTKGIRWTRVVFPGILNLKEM